MRVVVEDINDRPSDHCESEVEYRRGEGGSVVGFDIKPRTEDIITNIKLDREKEEQYELHVEDYDNTRKAA